MGAAHSRHPDGNMDNNDDDNYQYTLQEVLDSARMRVLASHVSESDEEEEDDDGFSHSLALFSKPKTQYVPNTRTIKTNEITCEINSTIPQLKRNRFETVASVLTRRQMGNCGWQNFSHGDKIYMNSHFIPNCVSKVNLHHVKAFCGTFSQDGDRFVSSTQDHIIRVYDSSRGGLKRIQSIYARDVGWSVLDNVFSPDRRHIAYCSWSKFIHVCSTEEDDETHYALPLHPDKNNFCVFSLTYTSDNREILCGACDGHMYIYDLEANIRSMKMDAHEDDISSVVFADNTSQLIYSGGDDAVIKVWDRRTMNEEDPRPVGQLAGHTDGVTFIDSKGDARYLISNSKDQTVKLWDIRAFSSQKAIMASRKAVCEQHWDYRWQPVPKRFHNAKKTCQGDSSLMSYRGHCVLHTLIRARFSPLESTGNQYIYTGCASGDILVYNVLTGRPISRLRGHRHCVRDVSWHPYRNLIVSSSWDGSLGIWRYQTTEAPDFEKNNSELNVHDLHRNLRSRSRIHPT